MAYSLYLRSIDHAAAVEVGRLLVREAVDTGDVSKLKSYVLGLKVDRSDDLIAERRARISKLRELNAPAVIVENELTLLEELQGKPYARDKLEEADFETLRERLANWCWLARTVQLGNWDAVLWYTSPVRREFDNNEASWTEMLEPTDRWGRNLESFPIEAAILGCETWPQAHDGDSLVGADRFDNARYNPPAIVARLADLLGDLAPEWDQLFFRRSGLRRTPMAEHDAETRSKLEFESAREDLASIQRAYRNAAAEGFGVCCYFV